MILYDLKGRELLLPGEAGYIKVMPSWWQPKRDKTPLEQKKQSVDGAFKRGST